jgi:F-type H+-transporting ATPase subunit c
MSKKLMFLVFAALMLVASPVFAADAATGTADQSGLKWIGIGIGMGLASGLCALGQGRATAGATEAMARNPGNTAAIRTALIIGLALIESLALYTFVIVFGK